MRGRPFITIGEVEHGDQRFLIVTPTGEQIVEGFQEARRLAHKLAGV